MSKFFKNAEYDPTKARQATNYDAKAQYRNNRNTLTSQAIRQLGEEWMYRKPPKGVFKELKIPVNQGSHLKVAGFYEDTVKPNVAYGKYLGKHKYHVYKAGREFGAPRKQLLMHDMSKLRPSEWKPYAAFWHGPKGVAGNSSERILDTKYGKSAPLVYGNFMQAREAHFKRNPHHFHKINKGAEQDFNTKLEMVADWYSTSRVIHEQNSNKPFPTFREWYNDRRATLNIDPEVIVYIDKHLNTK